MKTQLPEETVSNIVSSARKGYKYVRVTIEGANNDSLEDLELIDRTIYVEHKLRKLVPVGREQTPEEYKAKTGWWQHHGETVE